MQSLPGKGVILAGVLFVVCTLSLPVAPYLWLSNTSTAANPLESENSNPRANFWRAVRTGKAGTSSSNGHEAGVLIHNNGQTWRQYRTNILVRYGAYLMGGVITLIVAFYVLRGPVRVDKGTGDRLAMRFSVYQRIVHWFTAILFWLLALTGLVLLYGRYVLIPLFGPKGFAITAAACKEAHNLFGPIFLVALSLLIVTYAKDNLYQKNDLDWLKNGGGMFGRHASAGRFNLGEKMWFWLVCIFGLIVSFSGLVLEFSIFNFDRTVMGWSHFFHSATGILFISISFGHIFLGTIGTQGTLRGMTTGYVDTNWVKAHHDRWQPENEKSNN